ncbi:MAG: XisI protein [Pyrinomonadaceae bacterium]|nr:XisI protein [Pyrinomonadaceae bacterium]
MENVESYRQMIRQIISERAKIPYAYLDLELEPVFDRENDRYLLIVFGREDKKPVHFALIHVDIIEGKFWIRYDGTEEGVATDLLENGVPKEHIVLAFKSPEMRKYTEFAVC